MHPLERSIETLEKITSFLHRVSIVGSEAHDLVTCTQFIEACGKNLALELIALREKESAQAETKEESHG